jgi:glycosyltransferase involved in cell wall biosynthesis
MAKLKILYYNWVDFEDQEQRGGGVSIYQRNLIDAAIRHGDQAWFLSSGISYRPFTSAPCLREVKTRSQGVRKFEIVNSTILSPGHEAFGQDVRTSEPMERLFGAFLNEHGPFDVVHFNNLEGIPLSFLRLAREHAPWTKIVYSVHNYFAFCPQVNLWFQEKALCRDFHDGRKCVNCLMLPPHPRGTRRLYRLEYGLRTLGIMPQSFVHRLLTWFIYRPLRSLYYAARAWYRGEAFLTEVSRGRRATRTATKATPILDPTEAERFAARRQHFVEALNTYADHILAVSERVAKLTVGFGIDPAKVQTRYIGTRFAEQLARLGGDRLEARQKGSPSGRSANSDLHIAYLGYMRRDKGFYFYLKALQKMPQALARRLSLTFATKIVDQRAYERLKSMAHRFASVTWYDGYTHAQLSQILAGVDLGIVPVLWEDNLPQVAIECVASGVPILTSNRGGARELLDCPELVFQAGSCRDFHDRLQGILDNPSILSAAMARRARLYTPAEHYTSLRQECYVRQPQSAAIKEQRVANAIEAIPGMSGRCGGR